VRTGVGKSQTSRYISNLLKAMGKRVVSIRHPMPYGNLAEQAVQRFATLDDLKKHKCTIEEMEEYEPHIANGFVVYAGVDYGAILQQAQKEADVILWDGGNNDLSFYKPDLLITLVDPHRAGHELKYHPGETNLRMADVVIVNKVETAKKADIALVKANIRKVNPNAIVLDCRSPFILSDKKAIRGKTVVVVEDGPTLTHGGMTYGAGYLAAQKAGAKKIVSPVPYAVRSIAATYKKYPHCKDILPAMGYGKPQMRDLKETVAKVPADLIVVGTPIDLRRVIEFNKPAVRVRYELAEVVPGKLKQIIKKVHCCPVINRVISVG
jgi:predicted GTPase